MTENNGMSFAEMSAEDEIVNDWVADHAVITEHYNEEYLHKATICVPTLYTSNQYRLFLELEATGSTPFEALMMLRWALLDRPSTRHNICIDWLYTELKP
ncbi:hypothetical protein [Runella sp.]|uniref:hypothetical protein n=1 Tax=Runella sp. TaxID=1960881 RepID=UPI003D0B1702